MKIVFFVILSFLAIIGAAHIVFEIIYRFFKIKDDNAFLVLIPKKNIVDPEFFVRSAVAKVKKLGKDSVLPILCINDYLNETQKHELEVIAKDYSFVKVINTKKLKEKAGR